MTGMTRSALALALTLALPLALRADALSDANQLFSFAEQRYPQHFSPASQPTQTLQGYIVRYYPDTNTYIGVKDGVVYVNGQRFGVGIIRMGLLTDFITPTDSATGTTTGSTATNGSVSTDNAAASTVDLTNLILKRRDGNCAQYAGAYTSGVTDLSRSLSFAGNLSISVSNGSCTFSSNGIPNHDFGQGGAFATKVSAVSSNFRMTAHPQKAAANTALTLDYDNAILLNGVKVDIFAAACYGVGDQKTGCSNINQPWRFDPMSPLNRFGTDTHNAHTQPDGAYHYHGNPKALFDFSTAIESPVVGFAADGFAIFGTYFNDKGAVRKAESSYRLKSGSRPTGSGNPGGSYDGTYRDDYEYVAGSGDLDECNGMTVDGTYGYFITDQFPWIINCFKGTPDASFRKSGSATTGTGGTDTQRPPPPR
ncbi:MAG: hypothetical protein RLZZ227_1136 [Pseudomonadota bacterium]|jgi:hypothetical protein